MIIILPKVGDKQSIINLLKSLSVETLEKILDSMRKKECNLWLPKFKTQSKYTLNEYLIQLGLGIVFTSNAD